MEPHDEPLRDRLMAMQEPTAEQFAHYRREVEALLEQLRRRKWWSDAVRAVLTTLAAIVLLPLAVLFGLMFLYLLVGTGSARAAWLPATAGLACLAGAVVLMRWFFRRRWDDMLLEVKRLQARALELEEQLRRQERR
ncbi:MAG TPA: hypothetical protein VFA18_24435 [Gemmataceae bacterium]|nr:hypothetical protein [Gemmataceae bacterium]